MLSWLPSARRRVFSAHPEPPRSSDGGRSHWRPRRDDFGAELSLSLSEPQRELSADVLNTCEQTSISVLCFSETETVLASPHVCHVPVSRRLSERHRLEELEDFRRLAHCHGLPWTSRKASWRRGLAWKVGLGRPSKGSKGTGWKPTSFLRWERRKTSSANRGSTRHLPTPHGWSPARAPKFVQGSSPVIAAGGQWLAGTLSRVPQETLKEGHFQFRAPVPTS